MSGNHIRHHLAQLVIVRQPFDLWNVCEIEECSTVKVVNFGERWICCGKERKGEMLRDLWRVTCSISQVAKR